MGLILRREREREMSFREIEREKARKRREPMKGERERRVRKGLARELAGKTGELPMCREGAREGGRDLPLFSPDWLG